MQTEGFITCTDSYEAGHLSGPFRYQSLTVEKGRRPVGFRFYEHVINLSAQISGQDLTVTGESNSLEEARAKAKSELLERSTLITSNKGTQSKSSNGWAAHPDPEQARENAVFEIIERDATLAHWYTQSPLRQISKETLPEKFQSWIAQELSQSEFPEAVVMISTIGIGPSATCIVRNKNGFGVSGHATRPTLESAIESALAEACRAAHATLRRDYWGETLKLWRREHGPVDPGAHSVYYAYHEPFPKWLFGRELSFAEANAIWTTRIDEIIQGIDQFTFQIVLDSPICVGFARHPLAFDLSWGSTSENEVLQSQGAKRLGFKTVNKETHFVS